MTNEQPDSRVSGQTIRFTWNEGPTKGKTHEHVFHPDGTVEWHAVPADETAQRGQAGADADRPRYAAMPVGDDVSLVSYLSRSGYTLTVALCFTDQTLTGLASNENTWVPVRGFFEIAD
jgi:hypothetical protein